MLFIPSSFKAYTYIIHTLSPRPCFSNSARTELWALRALVKGTTTCYTGNYTRSPEFYCIHHSKSDFQNRGWDTELVNSDCGDGEGPLCHRRSPGNVTEEIPCALC